MLDNQITLLPLIQRFLFLELIYPISSFFVLTIEYNALRKVHDTIQMESKENVGTTFRIILPLQIDPNPFVTRSRA